MAYTLVPTELIQDGAVTSAKLDTNIAISGTLSVGGVTTLATHLVMGDNDKIKIGAGGDLEIYHDASNSYIANSTGNLYIGDTNGSVHIQAKLNEDSIVAAADGAVTLYYDNAVKLATSSAGVTVTGALTSGAITSSGLITATSLDISGDIDIDGTTNLDTVDIDGPTNISGAVTITAALVANGGVIFNEGSDNVDFRVESTGSTHMLFVDGGNNRVGINSSSPQAPLHIFKGESGGPTPNTDSSLVLENSSHTYLTFVTPSDKEQGILFSDVQSNNAAGITYSHNTDNLSIRAGDEIFFDAGADFFNFTRAGGNARGILEANANDFSIKCGLNNGDLIFKGVDGGTNITALTLDMSAAGAATFNAGVTATALTTTGGITAFSNFVIASDGGGVYLGKDNNSSLRLITNNTTRLTIANDGVSTFSSTVTSTGLIANVPTNTGLTINSQDVSAIQFKVAAGNQKNWGLASTLLAAGDFGLYQSTSTGGNPITAGAVKLYVSSSGNLIVGKSVANLTLAGLYVAPNDFMVYTNTSTDTGDRLLVLNRQNATGELVDFRYQNSTVGKITMNGSATNYGTGSDYRLKENVVTDWDATTRLKQLKPSRFNFITDADNTVDGFLAHEVQEIVPEAITGEKDAVKEEEYEVTPAVLDDDGNVVTEAEMGIREVPDYQGIDQSKLVPLLTKAIQEQQAQIEIQNTLITNLTARIETLEG